jgi:hypothetical protein
MNWDSVEGKWKQFKGTVKQKWGKLTDDDLDVFAGKRGQLTNGQDPGEIPDSTVTPTRAFATLPMCSLPPPPRGSNN